MAKDWDSKEPFEEFHKGSRKKELDVIVVFDRYVEGSIETHKRLRRAGTTVCPTLSLTLDVSSRKGYNHEE